MSIDLKNDVLRKLEIIHTDINTCRMCEPLVSSFEKPISMARGAPGKIVIVGQEPGKGEIASQRAFSGKSGRRLDQWLIASGFNTDAPRSDVYATSVAKCLCEKQQLSLLYRNCTQFLDRQLFTIRPHLIISLGVVAYNAVKFNKMKFATAVCELYHSDAEDAGFRTRFGFDYSLMVWPHPSPGSRWHNCPKNREKLQDSFDVLNYYQETSKSDEDTKNV